MKTVDRLLAVPVVIECDVVDDEFAVEPHSHILALHDQVEVIPVAAVILVARPVRAAKFFVATNDSARRTVLRRTRGGRSSARRPLRRPAKS